MRKYMKILLLAGCLFLAACGEREVEESRYYFYYVDKDQENIAKESFTPASEDRNKMLQEMIRKISDTKKGKKAQFPAQVRINNCQISDDVLKLDLDRSYLQLKPEEEILQRAAIIRNFLQIPDLCYIQFTVNGNDLEDSRGNPVGLLNNESFLEYSGKDITAYQYTELLLYFTDENGKGLVTENRSVYYSSNSPVEKVVVEQLIKGPKEEGHFATLPSDTGIIGVAVSDGIAYVNLDRRFVDGALPIRQELPIYSIVNSLTALENVRQVKISVNGESDLVFREHMSLDQLYESDTELVDGGKDS